MNVQTTQTTNLTMAIYNVYDDFMKKYGDPRTENWWMMSSPGTLFSLIVCYLYFCTRIGPTYMRDRKPFDLKNIIIVYNVIQIALSIFLVYEGLAGGWWNDYKFSCQPVDYSDNPKSIRMAGAVWWYFFAKVVELLDTVFFVLRKKNRQISFLHLYHHSIMPFCAWVGVKFLPGGHGTLLGVINSFIHIIMYSYYLVAGLGPQYQKYLWWKSHLTTMQLIQFIIIFYHNFTVMFRSCNYPKGINFLLALNAGIFLYMFGNFYYVNYIKKPKKVKVNGQIVNEKLSNGKHTNGNIISESCNVKSNGYIQNGSINGKTNGYITNALIQEAEMTASAEGKMKEC